MTGIILTASGRAIGYVYAKGEWTHAPIPLHSDATMPFLLGLQLPLVTNQ